MCRERFEELKHSDKLPSPSGVGLRLLMLTQSEDFKLADLVDTIQTDPALTGRLIKLASSAQGRAVAVTTVQEAALRLGAKTVCHVALGFSLISGERSGRCRSFDYDRFWSFSLATGVAARHIAEDVRLVDPAEAFTLGLLLNVGRLALASVHPEEYEDVERMAAEDPGRELVEIEREHLFIDHHEVAAAMLEDWGLPGYFSESARLVAGSPSQGGFEHVETERMLRILNAASAMADVCIAEEERRALLWASTPPTRDALGVEPERFAAIFDRVSASWKDWGNMLKIPTRLVPKSEDLARPPAPVPSTPEPGDGSERRVSLDILAVDDDPVSLKLLVTLLRRSGHRVSTASNGHEALAVYAERGAEVVITDWMMPEMDGLMLCQQLRRTEDGRKLYILLLTGRAEEERIVEAFQAGVDDYIVKPFKSELLSARIQPAIRVLQLQKDHDRQVREKERLNRQLDIEKRKFKAAAMTDSLTELPNRRYAMKRLEKEWANSLRNETVFGVIMLDIDHFKRINDQWGHDVGDVVLRATARTVQRVLRRGDTCARMGGEEFLVICPNAETPEGIDVVAERIRRAVEETTIQAGGFDGNVTVSLGTATRLPDVTGIDSLLKIADEAVYEAKRSGRNCVTTGQQPGSGRKSA